MVADVAQSRNLGFENLTLSGWKEQMSRAASDLREGKARERASPTEYSLEEQREIAALTATDRKVRAHERAHVAVGGELVRGAANFSYQVGPDGKRYAVAGEVSIDTSEGRTPEETLPKAQRIRDTALAPADPSPQDRRVAALATQMQMQASIEIAMRRSEEVSSVAKENTGATALYRQSGETPDSAGFSAYA